MLYNTPKELFSTTKCKRKRRLYSCKRTKHDRETGQKKIRKQQQSWAMVTGRAMEDAREIDHMIAKSVKAIKIGCLISRSNVTELSTSHDALGNIAATEKTIEIRSGSKGGEREGE
jgi:hypothetical protein